MQRPERRQFEETLYADVRDPIRQSVNKESIQPDRKLHRMKVLCLSQSSQR
jgi:hypothetical protein